MTTSKNIELSCTIKKIRMDGLDSFILVPDKSSTAFARYMMTHQDPDAEPVAGTEHLCLFAHPINSHARVLFLYPDKNYNQHYFLFSTVDYENLLTARIGKKINFEILTDEEELEANTSF